MLRQLPSSFYGVDRCAGRVGRRTGRSCRAGAVAAARSHREYARSRAQQIAYNSWEPWGDMAEVRDHVRRLRASRVSYEAIAGAAGVSPMTVHRVLHRARCTGSRGMAGKPTGRVSAAVARRLLAVTPATAEQVAARRDATGARRRLRALIALGHPPAMLAQRLGVSPRVMARIVGGTTATVSPGLHAAVRGLYDQLWDVAAPERTPRERKAAAAARALAASHGWPAPMGLDDARIDDPVYRPRARWRPAVGLDAGRRHRRGRLSTGAASAANAVHSRRRAGACRGSRCQAASAQHHEGGHS